MYQIHLDFVNSTSRFEKFSKLYPCHGKISKFQNLEFHLHFTTLKLHGRGSHGFLNSTISISHFFRPWYLYDKSIEKGKKYIKY